MNALRFTALCECSSQELAQAFSTILADSGVGLPAPGVFERRYSFEHLDRQASVLVTRESAHAAILLIARRGWTSHISGLAVAPTHRRQGIGRTLVRLASDEARRRGDRRLLVEVDTDNKAAQLLYESCAFRTTRRLVGFTRQYTTHHAPLAEIREIDTSKVAEVITTAGALELPWFFHPASLFGCSLPTRAHALADHAFAITTMHAGELHLRALFVKPTWRRQGSARNLINTLASLERAHCCTVRPLVPEGLCDAFFNAMGFQANASMYELEGCLEPSDPVRE